MSFVVDDEISEDDFGSFSPQLKKAKTSKENSLQDGKSSFKIFYFWKF